MKKIKEWISIQLNKNPGRAVILIILVFNLLLLLISSLVISSLAVKGTEEMSFWEAAFHTVTMVLDAGCIDDVVSDVGEAGVGLVIVCLMVVVIGMITFTGAVIGYLSNYISQFIEKANAGSHRLNISDHIVILNWNSRASEIINDLLYTGRKEKVVDLVESGHEEILKEVEERLSDTVAKENRTMKERARGIRSLFRRLDFCRKNKLKRNRVTVMVREGDIFSAKQLEDISLKRARSVLILGQDVSNRVCRYDYRIRVENHEKGNPLIIKALVLVAEITGDAGSADDQKIIVEVEDEWTKSLVKRIIRAKEVNGKCKIIPLRVHKVLGGILSQFSLMPELNMAYSELFSNKGMAFYALEDSEPRDMTALAGTYLSNHVDAIPLMSLIRKSGDQNHYWNYFAAESERDIRKAVSTADEGKLAYTVSLNPDYWIEQKNVIILGHNSRVHDIMDGFDSFRNEWNYKPEEGKEILQVLVIDDPKSLESMNYYKDYSYVIDTVEAEVFDRHTICNRIEEFVDAHEEDTSILILSDDTVPREDIDSGAIANLIYVQDIIRRKISADPNFDNEKIDVIVEIIDPKHYDVVRSYSVNNVIISNRYVSKMVMQLGEKAPLFDFYSDILTYDDADATTYESKEIYIKKVSSFFNEVPKPCTAYELIRAVYLASVSEDLPPEKRNPALVLGYVKPGGQMVLFGGDQRNQRVVLDVKDKLVVFSNH